MQVYVFDLGGVLIRLNVNRCMRAFETLMGEDNMRAVLGMDSNGEGVKAVSVATKQLMADFSRQPPCGRTDRPLAHLFLHRRNNK